MNITFLGTGTSMGVPVIACPCPVCNSNNPKDNRSRTSVLIEIAEKNIVIDTGPDFRQQMLKHKVTQLDAILYTHEHQDHTVGLHDIRAFNYFQDKPMEVFAVTRVQKELKNQFGYIFSEQRYPGAPEVNLNTITNTPFKVFDIPVEPIDVLHYKLPVTGFRIGDFSYITDANQISPKELDKVRGSEVLVLNALRQEAHISHFTLAEAIEIAKEVDAKHTYFTHLSHQMGLHDEISDLLGPSMSIAYDGLSFEL